MNQFRKLTQVCLISGALAGLVLCIVQHFTVIPLIETAETYETSPQDKPEGAQGHDDQGWRPTNGWQRTSLTVLTTMLMGIGFAATLFGVMALTRKSIDVRRGALWGLAGFTCVGLAPALGLPPLPPGVPVAALSERQLWWVATAVATGLGLWLIIGRPGTRLPRVTGVVLLSLPHLIGAPAATGDSAVPAALLHRFTLASLATTGMFWLTLGSIGGFVYKRIEADTC